MSFELIVFWVVVGWASRLRTIATGPIVYYSDPRGWATEIALPHIIGGVLGGWVYNTIWPMDPSGGQVGIAVAATGLGAYLGAWIVDGLVQQISAMMGRGRVRG